MYRIIFCILISFSCYSQTNSDFNLIKSHEIKDEKLSEKRKVNYVFKEKNWFVKYNPVSLIFGGTLLFYQKIISPQVSAGYAFEISCSNFSKQCIKRYGILKGVALSTDRLTRCNKISSADYHPVLINKDFKVIDNPEMYKLH